MATGAEEVMVEGMAMTPRAAGQIMADAAISAVAAEWIKLECEFADPAAMKILCWEYVRVRIIGTKTIPNPPGDET